MSTVSKEFTEGDCSVCRKVKREVQRPGRQLSSAVSAYSQNRSGLLSPSSRETQATCAAPGGSDCTQAESKVVLPNPAGAETSVSLCCRLAPSCAVRRERGIKVCDGEGMKNLVVRSWSRKRVDAFKVVSPACCASAWRMSHHVASCPS